MPEYFKIGKFISAHGLKGELLLKHNLGKRSTLKGLRAIFIEERKNSFIPWFIEEASSKAIDEVLLKIDGVNSREAARPLTQKEVWLPEEDFKKFASRSAPVSLLGYEIIDEGKPLGTILEVIEQPHQLLCRISMNEKEVLVPIHEETLTKTDHKNKQVHVKLPDGLLDIYLSQ